MQKYELKNLSFQYTSDNSSPSRCLTWAPLQDKNPTLEYTEEDDPYVRVKIQARLRPGCHLNVYPSDVIRRLADRGDGIAEFEVTIKPPVTLAYLEGPDFKDTLVFEAPVAKLKDINFFSFFRKSKVYFEVRYAKLSTDNTEAKIPSANIVPVFGGNIGFPLPWTEYVGLGYSMFQNLGNFQSGEKGTVQYSETAFALKGMWRGVESWGRPELAAVIDYRGRNIYQTSLAATDSKSFILGSTAVPGGGVDGSWYVGAAFLPWDHWASRIGIEFMTRFYVLGLKIKGSPYKSYLYDVALNYRLSYKWAVGLGYSAISQRVEAPDATVTEKAQNFFVRVSLIPYLPEEFRQ